jgi:hypothetical protein
MKSKPQSSIEYGKGILFIEAAHWCLYEQHNFRYEHTTQREKQ